MDELTSNEVFPCFIAARVEDEQKEGGKRREGKNK